MLNICYFLLEIKMFSKVLLNSVMLICSILCISSHSFAMDPNDPLYEAKMAFMRSQQERSPVYTPLNHDPERVRVEKEKYTFSPMKWDVIAKSDDNKQVKVPMGQFHWIQPGSDTILYTNNLCDCLGIILQGPQVGLGHISYSIKDHDILKKELDKIENPRSYKVSFVSHYYSKNLDEVTAIIKTKFDDIYADSCLMYAKM